MPGFLSFGPLFALLGGSGVGGGGLTAIGDFDPGALAELAIS